jgi:glycosyltransferase involved in cell wall biosynthesis
MFGMRLVLFTSHFPYGTGEEFIQDEIGLLRESFDEVCILSYEKSSKIKTRTVPVGVTVVPTRNSCGTAFRMLRHLLFLFYPRVWKEVLHSIRERGASHLSEIVIQILRAESMCWYIGKSEKSWLDSRADTVYYSYWFGAATLYLTRNRERLKGLFITRAQGGDCFFDRGYQPYREEEIRQLAIIFAISEAGRKDLLQHYGPKFHDLDRKIIVSRLGVRKLSCRMNPWQDSPAITIVSCSSVIPIKRLDLIIEALSLANGIPIHWIHLGDGRLMHCIKELAVEKLAGLDNLSCDFRGRLSKENVLEFYENTPIDIFVNCSDSEGIPVSIMEAMAYGIPCVARDVGGNSEIVFSGENGYLLPQVDSAVNICEAIRSYALLPVKQRKALRERAYATYQKRYDAETNYMLFIESIKEKSESQNG